MTMDRLAPRAKIGLVVVSSATVSEMRYRRSAPSGVAFFTSRMLIDGAGLDALVRMEQNADRAIHELATVPVDSIAYCCTVSGALRGPDGDRAFCQEMEQHWGIPVTSTMLAVVEALHSLGVRRIVVTSPYPESHHESERRYLEAEGIQPIAMHGMGLHTGAEYAAVSPDQISRFSLEHWDNRAEGLFISCMNFDGMAAAQALEDRLGKPVVTSHSATLWRALALAKVPDPIPGYGRLLREPRVESPSAVAGSRT